MTNLHFLFNQTKASDYCMHSQETYFCLFFSISWEKKAASNSELGKSAHFSWCKSMEDFLRQLPKRRQVGLLDS